MRKTQYLAALASMVLVACAPSCSTKEGDVPHAETRLGYQVPPRDFGLELRAPEVAYTGEPVVLTVILHNRTYRFVDLNGLAATVKYSELEVGRFQDKLAVQRLGEFEIVELPNSAPASSEPGRIWTFADGESLPPGGSIALPQETTRFSEPGRYQLTFAVQLIREGEYESNVVGITVGSR